jgi:hypothetical protein
MKFLKAAGDGIPSLAEKRPTRPPLQQTTMALSGPHHPPVRHDVW